MPKRSAPTTYNEPTVMWRLRHPAGQSARAAVIPIGDTATALWLIDDLAQDAKGFDEWTSAVTWVEEVRADLIAMGWRDSDTRLKHSG